MTHSAIQHTPTRPEWHCATCLEPWPCEPGQRRLQEETGGGTALAIAGWVYLEEYARDHPNVPLVGAFDRFIGWTRN